MFPYSLLQFEVLQTSICKFIKPTSAVYHSHHHLSWEEINIESRYFHTNDCIYTCICRLWHCQKCFWNWLGFGISAIWLNLSLIMHHYHRNAVCLQHSTSLSQGCLVHQVPTFKLTMNLGLFLCTISWWCHHMETLSTLLAFCVGNSPVTVEFPAQRPVTRSFDVFFDLCLNKQWHKQWRCFLFETPSCSLWRHCNV